VRQFKNHIELFSTFLDERRESQMENLKEKTDKLRLSIFFYKATIEFVEKYILIS